MNKEKVKEHFKRNKNCYICLGIGVTAGITCFYMRGKCAALQRGPGDLTKSNALADLERGVSTQPLSILSGNNNSTISNNVVNVMERAGRGHPGYMLYCTDLDKHFPSQKFVASFFGGSESALSGHLQGKLDDFCGHHFERVAAFDPA